MNRTVREERGAASLLKKAAVRANATASSSAGSTSPKFPVPVGGALGVSNTARTVPARSTTATTMGEFTDVTAFCTTFITSAALNGVGGGGGPGLEDDEPPAHDRRRAVETRTETPKAARKYRLFFVVFSI